ncbi:hypothetical protein [Nocardia sp. NPDC051832]|uniref:hypothetical protein n=1 Tax=Nocardia sp. NPDC051832 TaxID=3155673 RepID=UPI00341C5E8C
MIGNARLLLVAAVLPVLAVAACSSGDSKDVSSSSTTTATGPATPALDGDDPGETNGAVRIPLGQTRTVQVPADAVVDIKGNADWTQADLKCTAVTASGQQLDLLAPPADAQPESAAHGGTWLPLWTVSAPAGEITVGCDGASDRVGNTSFVRVVPRGLMP